MLLIQVPSVQEEGTRSLSIKEMKRTITSFSPNKVGSMGTVASVLLKRMKIRPDIEFSVADASIEACQRGLNVLVMGEERSLNELINRLNEFNATSEEKIRYDLRTSPVRRAKVKPKRKGPRKKKKD
jgi:predicted transcriptional regulator